MVVFFGDVPHKRVKFVRQISRVVVATYQFLASLFVVQRFHS